MNDNRMKLMLNVSRKYYLLGMKQEEISLSENISKSKVSRLLNEAKELGYIEFKLNFPTLRVTSLEAKLQEKFGLKYVFVSDSQNEEKDQVLSNLAKDFSKYMNQILRPKDIIGVSWGATMYAISKQLQLTPLPSVKITQLHGGIANTMIDTHSTEIVRNFGRELEGEWYTLPVPSIVDSSFIAKTLAKDSSVKKIYELIKKVRVAVFSVGTMEDDVLGVRAGYFSKKEFAVLREEAYVGDICSRYFKIGGVVPTGELYQRIMGMSLEELSKKEHKICLAIGENKAKTILSAIEGGWINALFTDEDTAKEMIRLYE